MPVYKLTYFETTGTAEVIRLIFNYAGQPFEDIRIPVEEWKDRKAATPFGCLPILEIDGQVYNQSIAISRFLAKQYGLDGCDEEQDSILDSFAETINDFRVHAMEELWGVKPQQRARNRTTLINGRMPTFLNQIQTIVRENGGFMFDSRPTWPDLLFLSLQPYLNKLIRCNILTAHPELQDYVKRVADLPGIREWMQMRPTKCCFEELEAMDQQT